MDRQFDVRGSTRIQQLLVAAGTAMFLGGLLVVAGIGPPSFGDAGSAPAARDAVPPADTDTSIGTRTITPSGTPSAPPERETTTGVQIRRLDGAEQLELTDETVRSAVHVTGPLREGLDLKKDVVIDGSLGLSAVGADVKLGDDARVTREVEADSIDEGATVSLADDARVGGVSVGPVTDGTLELKGDTRVDGGVSVTSVESDGEVKFHDAVIVSDDVRIGQLDGSVEFTDDTLVDGNLVIDRVGPDGDVSLDGDHTVRGDLIIRDVADDAQIDVEGDAVDGEVIVEGERQPSEDDK